MSDPDPIEAKARAKRHSRMAAYAQTCINRDYAEHGEDPVTSGGMLISRSLVQSIKDQNARRAGIPRSDGEVR